MAEGLSGFFALPAPGISLTAGAAVRPQVEEKYMSEKTSPSASIDEKQFQATAVAERYSKMADFIRITFNVLTGPRTFFATYFQSIDSPTQKSADSLSTFKYL